MTEKRLNALLFHLLLIWWRNKAWISVLTTLMQLSIGDFSYCNKAQNGNKKLTDGKERNKTAPICTWHNCKENHKISRKDLLEIINEFSKATWYRVHTQKSTIFLYTTMNIWTLKLGKQYHLQWQEISQCKSEQHMYRTCVLRTTRCWWKK